MKGILPVSINVYSLLDAGPDALVIINQAGQMIYVNAKTVTLFDYTREELLGRQVEKLLPDRYRGPHQTYRDSYFINPRVKRMATGMDFYGIKKNGQEFPVDISLSTLESTQGRLVFAAIRDVTELKALERTRLEAIQQTQEQQQHRIEETEACRQHQQQMIDTLCHELRNPLQGIFGNIALLSHHLNRLVAFCQSERQADFKKTTLLKRLTEVKDSVQAMDACAHHQKMIVDDMLSLLKIETQQVVLHDIVFNPKQVIKNVIKMLQTSMSKKNLYLVEIVPAHILLVRGDSGRLAQVLLNLLTNALKFTSTGGTLTVSLKYVPLDQQGESVELQFAVKDTGIGMTPIELSRIFDRFAQGSHKTYQEYGGSGLDLAISKGLVELMGGRIHVVSQKNQGTTFSFNVPCVLALRVESLEAPSPFFSASDAMKSPSIKRDNPGDFVTRIIPFCLLPVGMPLFVLSRGELCAKIFLKTEKNQTRLHKKRSSNLMQDDQQNVRKKKKAANPGSVSSALFALSPNTKPVSPYLHTGFSC